MIPGTTDTGWGICSCTRGDSSGHDEPEKVTLQQYSMMQTTYMSKQFISYRCSSAVDQKMDSDPMVCMPVVEAKAWRSGVIPDDMVGIVELAFLLAHDHFLAHGTAAVVPLFSKCL